MFAKCNRTVSNKSTTNVELRGLWVDVRRLRPLPSSSGGADLVVGVSIHYSGVLFLMYHTAGLMIIKLSINVHLS